MKPNFFPLLITTLIMLSSCNTYEEYDEESFPNYSWETDQTLEFKPTIEDNSKSYRLGFGLRHVYGLKNSSINISVKTIAPSGTILSKKYDFFIKDQDGDYISSCAGDLCDLETFVSSELWFEETGEYTFVLSLNERSKIAGVMAFGLILDEN